MSGPAVSRAPAAGDWSRYWRSADEPLEAMHAHFREHVYHRHSHDTYSFGVTESGAQSFTCRGSAHTSAAGMVMAFNPDDPHDGHAATGQGFSYRMIHIGPGLVADVLADIGGRPAGRPLFAAPVVADPELAAALRRLHWALTGSATPLERGERLTVALGRAARVGAGRPAVPARVGAAETMRIARRVRDLLDEEYAGPVSGAGPGRGRRVQPLRRLPGFPVRGRAGPRGVPAPAAAPGRPAGAGPGDAARAGRGGRGLRRPGPPDPVVPPLLRHYPRRLRPCRPVTRPGPVPWARRSRGRQRVRNWWGW